MRTSYGVKENGDSKFIISAPHAGGDDLKTFELAQEIARLLNASLVINDTYSQKSNLLKNSFKEDFNNLPWSDEEKTYLWQKRKPAMKEFYEHIQEYCDKARKKYNKAVVIYIHGMDDEGKNLGLDIGFGAIYRNGYFICIKEHSMHPDRGNNKASLRANPEDIERLRAILEIKLKADYGIRVGIGEIYAAQSKENGVQFHSGTPDFSFQLEISQFLRKVKRIRYTAELIDNAIKQVFK